MKYITSATTTNLGPVYGIRVEPNAALAGAVTIADADGTKAIIAVGTSSAKVYYGFNGSVSVTNASTENITVSILNTQG